MNLEKSALVAEIISAIAIVFSLIYVGYEIDQNTEQTKSSNRQSTAARVQDWALTAATSPELTRIISKSNQNGIESLSEDEWLQLDFFYVAFFKNSEEAYLQYKDGLLSEEYWRNSRAVAIVLNAKGSGRFYWEKGSPNYDPEFVAWLDQRLLEP